MASMGEGRAWTPRDHDRGQLHRICGMRAPLSMLCTGTTSVPATAVDHRARKGGGWGFITGEFIAPPADAVVVEA